MRAFLRSQGSGQSHALAMPNAPKPPQLPAIVLRCKMYPIAMAAIIMTKKTNAKINVLILTYCIS